MPRSQASQVASSWEIGRPKTSVPPVASLHTASSWSSAVARNRPSGERAAWVKPVIPSLVKSATACPALTSQTCALVP